MEFENRVALVTGGTGALGRDVTLDLLAGGGTTVGIKCRLDPRRRR
jgi:NAD(P)-dependent dehydrogenase (short-subunit alcohol dehydrogenase family)